MLPIEQQAGAVRGILFHEFAGSQASWKQLAVGAVEVEVGELAVFVAFGDAGSGEQSLGTRLQAAITSGYTTIGADRD